MAALEDFKFKGRGIKVGIGMNTGNVMLGIVGDDQRMAWYLRISNKF